MDHCSTSRNHPQALGLAERTVQTMRKGLRKLCFDNKASGWDKELPFMVMGYNMSRHKSLSDFHRISYQTADSPLRGSASQKRYKSSAT